MKDKYTIIKQIRVRKDLYDRLETEAEFSGIGQIAVLTRMLVTLRLRQGDLDELKNLQEKYPISIPDDSPRFNLRLTPELEKLVSDASSYVSKGHYSTLVNVILAERDLTV